MSWAGTRPGPDRQAGPDRTPTVWTGDGPEPGPRVVRIFDGVHVYRRTAAGRWVPDGQPGPGFSWREIPALLRVDATAGITVNAAGRLVTGPAPATTAATITDELAADPALRAVHDALRHVPADVLDLVDVSTRFWAAPRPGQGRGTQA